MEGAWYTDINKLEKQWGERNLAEIKCNKLILKCIHGITDVTS